MQQAARDSVATNPISNVQPQLIASLIVGRVAEKVKVGINAVQKALSHPFFGFYTGTQNANDSQEQPQQSSQQEESSSQFYFKPDPRPFPLKIDKKNEKKNRKQSKQIQFSSYSRPKHKREIPVKKQQRQQPQEQVPFKAKMGEGNLESNLISQILPRKDGSNSIQSASGHVLLNQMNQLAKPNGQVNYPAKQIGWAAKVNRQIAPKAALPAKKIVDSKNLPDRKKKTEITQAASLKEGSKQLRSIYNFKPTNELNYPMPPFSEKESESHGKDKSKRHSKEKLPRPSNASSGNKAHSEEGLGWSWRRSSEADGKDCKIDTKIVDSFYIPGEPKFKSYINKYLDHEIQVLSPNTAKAIDLSITSNKNKQLLQNIRQQQKRRLESQPLRLAYERRSISGTDSIDQKFSKKRSQNRHFTINELHEMLMKIKKERQQKAKPAKESSVEIGGSLQQGQVQVDQQKKQKDIPFSGLFPSGIRNLEPTQTFPNLFQGGKQTDLFNSNDSKPPFGLFSSEFLWDSVKKTKKKQQEAPPQKQKQEQQPEAPKDEQLLLKEPENKKQPEKDLQLKSPSFGHMAEKENAQKKEEELLKTPQKQEVEKDSPQFSTPSKNPFLKSPHGGLKLDEIIGKKITLQGDKKDESSLFSNKKQQQNQQSYTPSPVGTPRNSVINNSMCDQSEQLESANPNSALNNSIPQAPSGLFNNNPSLNNSLISLDSKNANSIAEGAAMLFGNPSSMNQPSMQFQNQQQFLPNQTIQPFLSTPSRQNPDSNSAITEQGRSRFLQTLLNHTPQESTNLFGPDFNNNSNPRKDRKPRRKDMQDRVQ